MRSSRNYLQKLKLLSVFFTFFVDNLSWAIVFPVFAPFFLDAKHQIFSPETSVAFKTMILGIFLSVFPLAQFLGAPLIGEFADKNGRRKAFIYTLFCTSTGFFLSALGMQFDILWILFVGRFISGLFSGNLSICLAAVSDLSEDSSHRVKYFGYLAMIAGASFILGAFIGGRFSDESLSPYFSPALPFWIGSIIGLVNLVFMWLFFQESFKKNPNVHFHFFDSMKNIRLALRTEKIKTVYSVYFLFIFSWNILMQFTPVVLVSQLKFSNSSLGNFVALLGLCWVLGAGLFSKNLIRFFPVRAILSICLALFSLLCFSVSIPHLGYALIVLVSSAVVLSAIAWPLCTNLISEKAEETMRGKILGISQSMQSLAMATSPLIAALAYIHLNLPFILAGLCASVASWIFFKKL